VYTVQQVACQTSESGTSHHTHKELCCTEPKHVARAVQKQLHQHPLHQHPDIYKGPVLSPEHIVTWHNTGTHSHGVMTYGRSSLTCRMLK
jgi:hypothetical protein